MGKFAKNSLITGEKIESQAIISWLSQFGFFIFSLLFIQTIIIPVLFILIAIINLVTTELAVTNKRVIGKTGFIQRTSIDLPLQKLESINISQGVIGRILGFGKVTIHGVGGNAVSIPFIKKPMDFRRAVVSLIDQTLIST